MTVAPQQRHTRANPCGICGGYSELPTGHGRRDYGFISADGRYERCSRPEWAGLLDPGPDGLYPHRLDGPCDCGRDHGAAYVGPPMVRRSAPEPDNGESARRIWSDARSIDGAPAERYLQSRGLRGPWPPSLRFTPSLKHSPSGGHYPAMIAAVCVWPDRQVSAIQRTYLGPDGSGKAEVSSPKMSLGPCAGGAVRLAGVSEALLLAEGMETAYSCLLATGIPAWGVLGAQNLARVVLPELPLARDITIAADPDPVGQNAAFEARERFLSEGRRVRIVTPPAGVGDWADAYLAEVRQAVPA